MKYEALGTEVGKLVDEKNKAYGASFDRAGAVMSTLYPNGIPPEQMTDALGIIRVLDKLFRIANAKDAFGESPWTDIAGYGLLGAARKRTPTTDIPATAYCQAVYEDADREKYKCFLVGCHEGPHEAQRPGKSSNAKWTGK